MRAAKLLGVSRHSEGAAALVAGLVAPLHDVTRAAVLPGLGCDGCHVRPPAGWGRARVRAADSGLMPGVEAGRGEHAVGGERAGDAVEGLPGLAVEHDAPQHARRNGRLASVVESTRLPCRQRLAGVGGDHLPLVLRERRQHLRHRPAARRCEVEGVVEHHERPSGAGRVVDDRGGVAHAARESVQLRHHERVGLVGVNASLRRGYASRQCWSFDVLIIGVVIQRYSAGSGFRSHT